MSGIHSQLQLLVQLAVVDNKFDSSEESHIMSIGEANGVSQEDIKLIIKKGLRGDPHDRPNLSMLTFDEKFEYLYNIIQLMKIDKEIFLSEIKYCEEIASRLGFETKVVGKMSSMIFSDPSITTNREKLKQEVKKFIV
jgi:hypothetical protein